MSSEELWHNTTVAILAGGLGTRLRSVVSDRPKAIARINGRPFLAFLLDQLRHCGVRHVVLCTGYGADQIFDQFHDNYEGIALEYSEEPKPLGTGGALRHALPHLAENRVLVMNGDSYLDADLRLFLRRHEEKEAYLSLVLAHVSDVIRYGSVQTDADGLVTAFMEKGETSGDGWINGGIYLMFRALIAEIPTGREVSLEREILPGCLRKEFYGFRLGKHFIDIGTPESYMEASRFFDKMEAL